MNVLMMMTANLIGFAIGTEGMSYMWGQMIGTSEGQSCSYARRGVVVGSADFVVRIGHKFMLVASGCLFVGVQIMFEYR